MATRRKATKKLYRRLKDSQLHDVCMTAPGFVEFKFHLKNHRQCRHVLVEGHAELISASPLSHLPVFLRSQLDAQKIIADAPRLPVQVSAILHFALGHYARVPLKEPSFPTLFLWHSPDKRRSYCLFAYLTRLMESRVYSVPELLELRGSQFSQALQNKVKLNPDLADIIKGVGLVTKSRRLRKTKDDHLSSTDSEEHIVFQGKKQSRPPVPTTNGEMEWKFRARTESEQAPVEPRPASFIEPRPAPTGIAAQQSEGFQRFFKAVVSPTHVRVTAGGRIVPNTRASTSPTAKWDKERSAPDSDSGDHAHQRTQENGVPSNGNMGPAMSPAMAHSMASPMYPGFPPMFPPMGAPMPFYPLPNGMPMGAPMPFFGMPHPQPPVAAVPPAEAAQGRKQDGDTPVASTENGQETRKPKPAPIKISPPDQFDHTKPYFYNGHLIYPPTPNGQLQAQMTPQMTPLPHSPYFQPGVTGHLAFGAARTASYAHPSPLPSMLSPNGLPPNHFGPPLSAGLPSNHQFAHHGQKPVAPVTAPSAPNPPITSIKPSEITKRQLDSLRSSLKYYEDQLQYNKHQIDEKWTQEQTAGIRKLIEQFEHNHKMQLNFETTYYPGGEKKAGEATDTAPCRTPSRTPPSTKESQDDGTSKAESVKSVSHSVPTLSHVQSLDQIHVRSIKERHQKAGINSSRGNDTSAALDALEAHMRKSQSSDPVKKSSLPTDAALAPPFEPRGTPTLPSDLANDPGSTTDATVSIESQWDSSTLLPLRQAGLWDNISSSKDFNGKVSSEIGTASRSRSSIGHTPYLVGKLPRGVNPYNARATDYVYSRELTEEEKRARHVYWGQVSVKGLGLPKFDGKDFYPPSPIKAGEKTEGSPKLKLRQLPTGRPDVDYNFELPRTDIDPFRASRDSESIRSDKSGAKFSRAVPIVNPESLHRENDNKTSKATNGHVSQSSAASEDVRKVLQGDDFTMVSPTKSSVGSVSEKKLNSLSRRALERSSNKSGNDLWQSMLKKGSTSGSALPSAVTSTTAKGYLPQYTGHAAAMLSPAIANANGSPVRASPTLNSKSPEHGIVNPQLAMEKLGENCPPQELSSKEADIIADLHQRMLRDAERRGVIGPGWRQ